MLRPSQMTKTVPGTSLGKGLHLKGLNFLEIMINQFSSKEKSTEGLFIVSIVCYSLIKTSNCNFWHDYVRENPTNTHKNIRQSYAVPFY